MNVTAPSSSTSPKHRPGFTLVELLVVITIILLLTAVVIISTRAVRSSAAKAADMNTLKSLASATIAASDDSTGMFPALHTSQNPLPHWLTDRTTLEDLRIYKEQCYSPGKGLPGGASSYDWWFASKDAIPVQVHYVYFANDGEEIEKGWYKSGSVVAPKTSEFRGSQTVLEDFTNTPSSNSNKVFPRTINDDCWYPILWSSLCYKSGSKFFCTLQQNDKPLGVNVFYLDGHVEWVPYAKMTERYKSGGTNYMW